MEVIIEKKSGFCFGVRKAIRLAEEEVNKNGTLYCLGDIVHNENEVERLQKLGLKVVERDEFFQLKNCKVLIRAHGEPPQTYAYAKENNIELIDGTCPVVLKLQENVKACHTNVGDKGTVVIFGKPEHPEVIGLNGQINGKAKVVLNKEDLDKIDFTNPIILFSQTTMSKEKYWELKTEVENRLTTPDLLDAYDTICGQVANRAPGLETFCSGVDAVVFVGGKKSSNSKVLFSHCQKANNSSFFISSSKDVAELPLANFDKVGVCGATSTPRWLMEEVADKIETTFT